MKTFKPEEYKNALDHIKITTIEITRTIINFKLEFIKVINNDVEYKIKFPTFLDAFYHWVYFKKSIPSQEQFYEHYMTINDAFFKENKFDDQIIYAFKARIYRTYPSLVRDLHFSFYLKEKLTKYLIIYSRKLDVEEGIDIIVATNKNFYAINLFTETKRANLGRYLKTNRHSLFENIKYIDVPIQLSKSYKVGDFYLYGESEMQYIDKFITERE